MAPDPEDLATDGNGGEIVVVSSAAGKVTLLNGDTLRPLKVLSGFESPHIAAIAPDGQHAYVTDDARGTLTAIDLADPPRDQHDPCRRRRPPPQLRPQSTSWRWVALGESAASDRILSARGISATHG